uniref:Protein xylosyltransferase n=1 Tax=Lotharella globosa TaxID=91324 RepID=A0A7S3Z9R5_9EUKA|mmetsp:Transcript_15606/g.31630  ORF Transcript_15606/g.31630 Transcript_15606/m.31630 type:complete len:1057 (+) Transcript_15606:70-3240(+)|eukprot:CAMPEP_0167818326 /NCGR_PEP_ID=MMETSP0112_2-20121227/4735_1 /TAXON_ID=91324 /ORGANISM="Lotharella globosa, Strain CCCM811" /LENGTH=1056 /DNA_ID=CAMNT_0007718283 /DNA_START=16 /DNA_END=3186 /DNA_ORIENTATION=+
MPLTERLFFAFVLSLVHGLRNEELNIAKTTGFSHVVFGKGTPNTNASALGLWLKSEKFSFSLITVRRNRKTVIGDWFETSGVQNGTNVKARNLNFTIEDLQKTKLVSANYDVKNDTESLAEEVSITNAHHAAIKEFLNSGSDYALVFESDAILQKNKYSDPMGVIHSLIENAPHGWHEINLGRCAAECFRQIFVTKVRQNANLVEAQNQYCSTAYLLNKEGGKQLDALFSSKTTYTNYLMKSDAYDADVFEQYSVEPRIFAHARKPKVCNGAECVYVEECGFTDISAKANCVFRRPCGASGSCYALDVAAPGAFKFSLEGYPEYKVDRLDEVREQLKGKHLRIRGLYKFLSGCGFFTFPMIVINQLEFAYRNDLVGKKPPFVYMPENHHYSDCHNDSYTNSTDFWHKWFKPLKMRNYSDVAESDVWEFSQDSIITGYFDESSVHEYPYPNDDDWECGEEWLAGQRHAATSIMKDFIHVKDTHVQSAIHWFKKKFDKANRPVLGLHMRGTDKFVHPIVDPALYINATDTFQKTHPEGRIFLATDDWTYFHMFNDKFPDIKTRRAERDRKNVLYNDAVNKDVKSLQVLEDSLALAQTDTLVKCWSGVSEFAVYFRSTEFGNRPWFKSVIDLEVITKSRKSLSLIGTPAQPPSAPMKCEIQPLPDYSGGKTKQGQVYCCPHLNSNSAVEREAAQLKIGKPKTGKGAIVILSQNKGYETSGRTRLDMLGNTIRLLYKNYNDRQKDDIIVLHTGDLDEETQKALSAGRPEISFLHMKGENRHPADGIGATGTGLEDVEYRKVMQWYAIRLWPAMKAKGYKWVCGFGDSSYLLSPIPYNLFGFMEHYGYDYSYRNIARGTGLTWDDPDSYTRFLRDYSTTYMNGKTGWMLDACKKKDSVKDLNRENCGEFYGFYNTFFIGHIDRFMEPDIHHFLKNIDDSGVIFTKLWNDYLIQSVTTQFFVDKAKTFHFTGWTYAHNYGSHDKLRYGIMQIGLFEENPYKAYYKHMGEELKWDLVMHQQYLVNVNGLLTLAAPNPANCCANKAPMGWAYGNHVLAPSEMIC